MTYFGYNGIPQTLEQHVAYLEECARRWEEGGGNVGAPSPETAAVVRARKWRLLNEASDGGDDGRAWFRRHAS